MEKGKYTILEFRNLLYKVIKMKENSKCKINFLVKLSLCLAMTVLITLLSKTSNTSLAATDEDVFFLSDMEYIANQSYVGYDQIRYDRIDNGSKISVKIDGQDFSFDKGIWAHASSQVTYDISQYHNYKYFTAYIGLNTTSAAGDGVKMYIYTSQDGATWTEYGMYAKNPKEDATFVQIDISNVNYIRLSADQKANKSSDHSVYADAKLVTENYIEEMNRIVVSKAGLEKQIKEDFANENVEENKEFEHTLLKRELISRIGENALKIFLAKSSENRETYEWLTGDVNNIRLYLLGGTPDGGNYINSLTQLNRLYQEYKEDFELTESLHNQWQPELTYGELYKKMAISLSLTHAKVVGSWMQGGNEKNQSDALKRYAIYKYMHKNGKLRKWDNNSYAPMFEALRVEEMRLVMNNPMDDESILWLNAYTQDRLDQNKQEKWITPHPYIAYTQPNYNNPVFYSEENKDYFNNLFAVKDPNNPNQTIGLWDLAYTIPGGNSIPSYTISVTRGTSDYKLQKVWMNFRNQFGTGAICGGIANSGANIRAAHGIPAMFIYQPYHGAILHYAKNAEGKGFWGIDNDCDGWALSSSASTRFLMGWGNASWNIESPAGTQWIYMFKYNALYIVLGQEAINDYDNFVKAEEQIYLAKVYETDTEKQIEKYNKAIEKQPINLDAWVGLIDIYKANPNTTEEQYYELAERIANDFKYFPLPMKHLCNLIKPKLTSVEYEYQFTLLQTRALTASSQVPSSATDKVIQPTLTSGEANFLLGRIDKTIATFSFDGTDGGKIVLSSKFDGNGIRWDYCIDGNPTGGIEHWNEVTFTADEEHKWQLSQDELNSIQADNDIYVHIYGVNYSEQNLYKIEIVDQALPNNLYANDWENKVIGANEQFEWRYTEADKWTKYSNGTPNLTGNKTVQVRLAATQNRTASPASELYTFRADDWTNTRKYVPIEHLAIHSYSSQSLDSTRPFYAPNAIDGNIKTLWHTNFKVNVLLDPSQKPFIAITLDEPKHISAVEFIQKKYRDADPIFARNVIVYVSNDGQTWIEVGRKENCEQNEEFKSIEIAEPIYGKYLKIELETYDIFAALSMVNLFEDETKVTHAGFSFDGENAGEIVLIEQFKDSSWEYSLDGGTTWKQGSREKQKLTETELQQINAENGIKVRINGNESTISVARQDAPVISAYLNDLENRLIGINDTSNLEWKIEGTVKWTSYQEEEPIVSGNKKLLIRKKATSTYLPSDAVEFQFTKDNSTEKAKYIPITHLSVHSFSNTTANRNEPPENAIDGLPTTMWHTNRQTTTMGDPRWIIIALDEPRYISKIEYVKLSRYLYGILKDGSVSVSMDGENWEVAQEIENLYNPTTAAELGASEDKKDIVFAESKKAKYIKIECTKSCDYVHGNRNGVPMDYFFSAAMFNIFEDLTKAEQPIAEVEYSTEQLTNQNVTATLVNENMDITVTNNNGSKTYTFTENGTFIFEFVNSKGIKGTAKAKVDWICKTLPTPSIQYSPNTLTNQDVIATVTFDREGTEIVDENGQTIENGNIHTFRENGKHEFKFVGPYGNAGTVTATVDWIDKVAPIPTITYSAEYKTNQDIIATITFDKENVRITNNNGSNTYTFTENASFIFTYEDPAGNTGTATATVNNIDRTLPVATIEYDRTTLTNQDVTATITFDKENVRITNNNGSNQFTFTENKEFVFEFVGPAGNAGTAVANVTWIDKKAPVATITYNINKLTNQDVTATITFNEENVKITNNNGSNQFTFVDNGRFMFTFEDMAGNKGTATAEVTWIDKLELISKITYDINDLTNQDVTATITFNKNGVKILDSQGNEIPNGDKYVFEENGKHEFRYIGPAGNTGTAIAEVTWIDKIPPAAFIYYDRLTPTKENVTATVTFDEGGVTIVDEQGNHIPNGDTHIFTENGSYTFHYIGPLGNKGTAVANVGWIDRTAPTADIRYSTTAPTNQDVTVTLVNESEPITITTNNGRNTYTFKENGTFTFEFVDEAGNKGTATATVRNIDKILPVATINYDITTVTNQNVTATITFDKEGILIVNDKGEKIDNQYVFTENGKHEFKYVEPNGNTGVVIAEVTWIKKSNEITSDKYQIEGNLIKRVPTNVSVDEFRKNIKADKEVIIKDKEQKILKGTSKIGTGMKAYVGSNIYTFSIMADIDGNGELTITDLAKMCLHYLGEELLKEEYFEAADLDENGKVTITDLAKIQLLLIEK